MVLVIGEMNLFQEDLLPRIGWRSPPAGWRVVLGGGVWKRVTLPASAFGAAVIAVVINLLAAGGIGFPSVALALWLLVALGLNLREDRGCGQLREVSSPIPGFALAIVWAALAGSFVGAILPFWRSEAAVARADAALRCRPPTSTAPVGL